MFSNFTKNTGASTANKVETSSTHDISMEEVLSLQAYDSFYLENDGDGYFYLVYAIQSSDESGQPYLSLKPSYPKDSLNNYVKEASRFKFVKFYAYVNDEHENRICFETKEGDVREVSAE